MTRLDIALYTFLTLAFIVAAIAVGVATKTIDCHVRWADTSIPYRVSFWGNCLVQHNGIWIPASSFRQF